MSLESERASSLAAPLQPGVKVTPFRDSEAENGFPLTVLAEADSEDWFFIHLINQLLRPPGKLFGHPGLKSNGRLAVDPEFECT